MTDPYQAPTETPGQLRIGLTRCARCGQSHDALSFKKLALPIAPPEMKLAWEFWATCPTNGDPILLSIGMAPMETA